MLGIIPKINPRTGKEEYLPDPKTNPPELENYELVILDESSMISSDLYKLIQQKISETKSTPKFLFLGDPAQLPPVGEEKSLTFSDINNTAELTEVVRYKGAILKYANDLRKAQQSNLKLPWVQSYSDNKTLITLTRKDFYETVIKHFQSENFNNNPDYCRLLAWTNQYVDNWNHIIRREVLGDEVPPYTVGETLVAKEPCIKQQRNPLSGEMVDVIFLHTSNEIVIESSEQKVEPFNYSRRQHEIFYYWEIKGIDAKGNRNIFKILDQEQQEQYQSILKHFAENKSWKNYWALRKNFHKLQYAYALTVHRSQGSTFNKVFLDLPNLLRNPKPKEKKQLLYTASTRASHQLIVKPKN